MDELFEKAKKMMEEFAEASLVNPSYQQIKEVGLHLTENQLTQTT